MPLDPSLTEFSTASPVIASFDFSDIRSGTGIQSYFLYDSETSAGTDEHLSETAQYSQNLFKSIEAQTGALAKRSDVDFDLTVFQIPQDVEGTGTIQLPFAYEILNGTGTGTIYVICRLKKNDVEIASVQSVSFIRTISFSDEGVWALPITIPFTHFQVGDTLRLTIEIWASSDGGEQCSFAYGIDPLDRAFTFKGKELQTTISKLSIPYRLNS